MESVGYTLLSKLRFVSGTYRDKIYYLGENTQKTMLKSN